MTGYFQRIHSETPTRLWINNATPEEAALALEAGAVGATTNPTYPARLLRDYPEQAYALIRDALRESDDDDVVGERVYRQAVARLQQVFLPLYEQTGGHQGYVAMQGDPRVNHDADAIVNGALEYRDLGPNIIVKVPATPAGATALEQLVAVDCPTIATLGFSVDQAVYIAETYKRAAQDTGKHPPCYVTFIAGILDEHLTAESERRAQAVSDEAIKAAGCAGTRVAYRIFRDRQYEVVLMGGGARGPHHFSELVGGNLAITIGWELADAMLKADDAVTSQIDVELSPPLRKELETHLPDYVACSREHALTPEQFVDFGPVAHFQRVFLAGTEKSLAAIAEARGSSVSV